jgi:hypothetical protein
MNFACQVVGENIRATDVAVACALSETASPAGRKHKPTHRHERITLKTIASENA